jgi:hypothetical protein
MLDVEFRLSGRASRAGGDRPLSRLPQQLEADESLQSALEQPSSVLEPDIEGLEMLVTAQEALELADPKALAGGRQHGQEHRLACDVEHLYLAYA